jgi:hypothetical protein
MIFTAEAQALLRRLIVHDRAADWRDGQGLGGGDYACIEMQHLLEWLQENAPEFARTIPQWCFDFD